jgi:hypothetical protein
MEDLYFYFTGDKSGCCVQSVKDGPTYLNGIEIVRLYTIFVPSSYVYTGYAVTVSSNFYRNVVFGSTSNSTVYWQTDTSSPSGKGWCLLNKKQTIINDGGGGGLYSTRGNSSNPNNQNI